jgi:hypothetical protein
LRNRETLSTLRQLLPAQPPRGILSLSVSAVSGWIRSEVIDAMHGASNGQKIVASFDAGCFETFTSSLVVQRRKTNLSPEN